MKDEIKVDGPDFATDVGSCNGCTRLTNENGTISGAVVYQINLRSLSFRLCPLCMDVLILKLSRAR